MFIDKYAVHITITGGLLVGLLAYLFPQLFDKGFGLNDESAKKIPKTNIMIIRIASIIVMLLPIIYWNIKYIVFTLFGVFLWIIAPYFIDYFYDNKYLNKRLILIKYFGLIFCILTIISFIFYIKNR